MYGYEIWAKYDSLSEAKSFRKAIMNIRTKKHRISKDFYYLTLPKFKHWLLVQSQLHRFKRTTILIHCQDSSPYILAINTLYLQAFNVSCSPIITKAEIESKSLLLFVVSRRLSKRFKRFGIVIQ